MNISQLRTLKHVAELGSLSRASDRLHVAQPALSRQIRLLEDELGARLFERHGRGMVTTDIGHEILSHALRIMAEVEEIYAKAADANKTLTGRVVIGMPPTVAELITLPFIASFRATHPHVSISFVTAFSGYLVDWQERGEVDLAVLYDPQTTRSIRIKPLLTETFFLIGGPTAGLSLDRPVRFAELGRLKLVLPGPRHAMRTIFERCASEAGITLNVDIEVDSLTTLKDLVRSGHDHTLLPLAPLHDDLLAGRLSAAPLLDPTPNRRLVLSFPSDRPTSRGTRIAADLITGLVADLVNRDMWNGKLPGQESADQAGPARAV